MGWLVAVSATMSPWWLSANLDISIDNVQKLNLDFNGIHLAAIITKRENTVDFNINLDWGNGLSMLAWPWNVEVVVVDLLAAGDVIETTEFDMAVEKVAVLGQICGAAESLEAENVEWLARWVIDAGWLLVVTINSANDSDTAVALLATKTEQGQDINKDVACTVKNTTKDVDVLEAVAVGVGQGLDLIGLD